MADPQTPNSSLQKMPPNLPPEKLSEKSISAMDAYSTDEMSYTRRLLAYALQQTREHNKMELKAGLLAALICGALVGGITLGNLFLSGVAFVLTLITLFFLHLFHSASALDKEQREKLIERTKERDSLKAQLEGLMGAKLRIEVNTLFSSMIDVRHNTDRFEPPEIEPIQFNQYDINARLYILFDNGDSHQINAVEMSASLVRITRNGKGKEKEVPHQSNTNVLFSDKDAEGLSIREGFVVPGRTRTPYRLYSYNLVTSPKYGQRLNENCFIRVTLKATGQFPYSADIYPDWEAAREEGSIYIYPTLYPKTRVLYRVHKWIE